MGQASKELKALSKAILEKCGFFQHAVVLSDAIKEELEGVYTGVRENDEDESAAVHFGGTVSETYEMFDEKCELFYYFNKFSPEHKAFLQSVSRDDCLHVDCAISDFQRCTLSVSIPALPALATGKYIGIEIIFDLQFGYDTVPIISGETSTTASDGDVNMAMLAYC